MTHRPHCPNPEACRGCYEVELGRWIHPPRSSSEFTLWTAHWRRRAQKKASELAAKLTAKKAAKLKQTDAPELDQDLEALALDAALEDNEEE
jgi:hypothetical protein